MTPGTRVWLDALWLSFLDGPVRPVREREDLDPDNGDDEDSRDEDEDHDDRLAL
jgi:hypothetical protein